MARRAEFYYDEKTGYYRKRIKLPSGCWKDVRARTKEELRSKLYDLETAQRMGLILDDTTTVAELAVEWYNNRKAGLSLSRQGDYRNAINLHICPVIGAMRVRDVKPEHCQRVMAQAAELSYSAQQKIVSTLKQLFSCAVDNGLALRSPAEKIKAKGKKAEEKVALTKEQCAQLEAAVFGTRAYIFVMLGLYAGLRREEICGLRWCDIDLQSVPPRLTVNNAMCLAGSKAEFPAPLKSKAAHRTIPLPLNLAQALREEKEKTNSDFVLHTRDGDHLTYQSARNIVSIIDRRCPMTDGKMQRRERIGQERGKPIASRKVQKNITMLSFRVTPHQLRHTYATRLVESGMNIKQIQYLLGHDDVHLTLSIYSHVTQNRPEELIGAVSMAFSPDKNPGENMAVATV